MIKEELTEERRDELRNKIQILIDNGLHEQATILSKQFGIKLDIKLDGAEYSLMEGWLSKFITCHPSMMQLKDQVRILAKHQDAVLICGESGTGKELIARALHGKRNPTSFIKINAAGLPEHLIESELFGHVKGAFTGASSDKHGLFRAANDGTLFLDEIGDLPLVLQAKFLTAIQDRVIRKVGSNEDESINCRIISATHHNIPKLIIENKFRLDLYARLSTFELATLPLRERIEDIPLIVASLDKEKKCNGIVNHLDIEKHLCLNIRSLQRIVRRKLVLDIEP